MIVMQSRPSVDHIDGEFFLQFAAQSIIIALTRFYFSARKFPFQRKTTGVMTLADQELVVAKDQPGNDVDGRWSIGFHVKGTVDSAPESGLGQGLCSFQ